MRVDAGGWQATMIDLSLILFLLTAAALTQAEPARGGPQSDAFHPVPSIETQRDNASAIYVPGAGAPAFAEWLAEQAPDPRQRLTILSYCRPGHEEAAARSALGLLAQAADAAPGARILLERGDDERLVAVLAYDQDAAQMARSLLQPTRLTTPDGGKP